MDLSTCNEMLSVMRDRTDQRYLLTTLSLTTSEFAQTKTARGIVRGVGRGMGSAERRGKKSTKMAE